MASYTVTLTDAEVKAMEYESISVEEWAQHVVKNRARKAMDIIYNLEVARMTADPLITSIPADKEAVVLDAVLETAKDRQDRLEREMAEGE